MPMLLMKFLPYILGAIVLGGVLLKVRMDGENVQIAKDNARTIQQVDESRRTRDEVERDVRTGGDAVSRLQQQWGERGGP